MASIESAVAQHPRSDRSNTVALPYEVRINGSRRGAFADLRDAIASARLAKQERPSALIDVADRATGQLMIQVDL
jgi:hypothetical protein